MADTACEIILLHKNDIEKVLESFPVLQLQIDMIQNNENYRSSLIETIKDHGKNKSPRQVLNNH